MSAPEEKKTSKVLDTLNQIKQALRGLKVYALVGKSGTGKSFKAKMVAKKYDIDVILDDGLVIYKDKIIAGKTAKREKYALMAVKVALYDDVGHRQEVINALEEGKFKRILVLGTSDKMVKKIVYHLQLPDISKIIRIEDVSTPTEIETALKNRKAGRHVIPVPSVEVKRDYAHIFYDGIKVFFRNKGLFGLGKKNNTMVEKTIVKPQFQDGDKGQLSISETALTQLVINCVEEFDGNIKPLKVKLRQERDFTYVIRLSVAAPNKGSMAGKIHDLQKFIINNIESYTGIFLKEVHISIDKLINNTKGAKKNKNDKT
ncbi:MAG: hypothetical protein FWE37_09295 [Spirochaetaceae bacterium]|nr:hypothetical protein [Spirochaetaceae bacterium]